MNKKTLISALTLSAVIGTGMALPATASAHEVIKEKRVKVIKTTERRGHVDRRYVERHREVVSRWAPPRYGHHKHHHNRGHGHKFGHRKHRYEHREYREYRPVERHRDYRRHDDGVRVRIDYDFWL